MFLVLKVNLAQGPGPCVGPVHDAFQKVESVPLIVWWLLLEEIDPVLQLARFSGG